MSSTGGFFLEDSIYQASEINTGKRVRRTGAQVKQLERQIIEVLEEDHPQSVRHVFYRMTNPRLPEPVEKSDRGYTQVQNRCALMRREGRLPYHWFADLSRRGYFTHTFANASDFILSMQGAYRADLWREAEYRCEVWCESRSIASTILKDCKELAVDLYPCGGFSSMTFVHEAAMQHNNSDDARPLKIFYIGDYDPAGLLIDRSLEGELRNHLNPDIEMDFLRIGITPAQIREYDLPSKPRKKSEKRLPNMKMTVEAEAMPARQMREILSAHVEALLPENALHVAKIAEESERQQLEYMAEMLSRER